MPKSETKLIFISAFIGLVNALIFVVFEFITTQGTQYLWNGLLNTDERRILVIPVAIIFSILFSATLLLLKQKRIGQTHVNLFEENAPTTVVGSDLIILFVVGCASLLAGASLGPEGSLVAIASVLGVWLSQKTKLSDNATLLSLSSIGALLVAFFGSLAPIIIPLLLLYKKEKIVIPHMILPIVAGFFAYLGLISIKGHGYGSIPLGPGFNLFDVLAALFLGVVVSFASLFLKLLIQKFIILTKKVDIRFHWLLSAAIFGALIGILYFLGGEATQFSGKEGTQILIQNSASYTLLLILIMLIVKLVVTGWSVASGYRGGMIFPSIFTAVSLGLILEKIDPALSGSGVVIGSVAGMLTAMSNPALSFILIISMIPFSFIALAIAGFLGTILGTKLIKRFKFLSPVVAE